MIPWQQAADSVLAMDSASLLRVGAAFEAMLLQQCLAPLAKESDPMGSVGLTSLAQTTAEGDSGGFGGALAAQLGERER